MSRMNAMPARSIDEYITMQPDAYRPVLEKLFTIIKSAALQAEELISYQIPSFKYYYMLVGFGVNKKYCSFYTMSPTLVKAMKEELKTVKLSGATIHFSPDEKLPIELIRKIVKARMKENKELAKLKKVNV
jgi:uncharacterized protein YdhG (YjbR/CyaY superfamily)